LVCQQIGLDCERIFPLVAQSAEAIWDPLYGTRDLGPFGGSCLPKDTFAFLSWAKEQDIETPLVQAVLKVNEAAKKRLESTVSKVSRS
jgi:UDP-glucose 6-dehydrogenase